MPFKPGVRPCTLATSARPHTYLEVQGVYIRGARAGARSTKGVRGARSCKRVEGLREVQVVSGVQGVRGQCELGFGIPTTLEKITKLKEYYF